MYSEWIYYSFIQLRKQFYKLKTRKWWDKYSKIELNKNKFKTFKRFCDECEDFFSRMYRDEVTPDSIQEVFDKCLDLSQRKQLKRSIF